MVQVDLISLVFRNNAQGKDKIHSFLMLNVRKCFVICLTINLMLLVCFSSFITHASLRACVCLCVTLHLFHRCKHLYMLICRIWIYWKKIRRLYLIKKFNGLCIVNCIPTHMIKYLSILFRFSSLTILHCHHLNIGRIIFTTHLVFTSVQNLKIRIACQTSQTNHTEIKYFFRKIRLN